jgi:glyceraldehyde-3-phosphate dehydrogenase (NADP+)
VGNPLDNDTSIGPLITEADAIRVEKWVNECGGKILTGGKRNGPLYGKFIL